MQRTSTHLTHSQEETAAIGHALAAGLRPGAVLLLFGDLGAGKTAFVRGVADGLGIEPDEVSSPTFTLVQEYRGGFAPLIHVDLYRLDDPREIDDLGLDEMGEGAVTAIEWAEKHPSPPADAVRVVLTHVSDTTRQITVERPNGSSGSTPTDSSATLS
jgi:tRNA threonylcarbamoyladenosine biosynthesis protein TsaE